MPALDDYGRVIMTKQKEEEVVIPELDNEIVYIGQFDPELDLFYERSSSSTRRESPANRNYHSNFTYYDVFGDDQFDFQQAREEFQEQGIASTNTINNIN